MVNLSTAAPGLSIDVLSHDDMLTSAVTGDNTNGIDAGTVYLLLGAGL